MILVDTSVWIDHLRKPEPRLMAALEAGQALIHPFVVGELACGNLKNRVEFPFIPVRSCFVRSRRPFVPPRRSFVTACRYFDPARTATYASVPTSIGSVRTMITNHVAKGQ